MVGRFYGATMSVTTVSAIGLIVPPELSARALREVMAELARSSGAPVRPHRLVERRSKAREADNSSATSP